MATALVEIKEYNKTYNKILIGGIHSKSNNTIIKWTDLKNDINRISNHYQFPIILYIDINCDINDNKFIKFEAEYLNKG